MTLAATKYPQTLLPGATFPTGWHSTDSVHYERCPKCGALPGFYCITATGKRGKGLTGGAHGERQAALSRNHPDIAALSRRGLV